LEEKLMVGLHQLAKQLALRLSTTLPGAVAHEQLRAKPVGNIIPNFLHKTPPKRGSVLILLYQEGDEIKFPLIKRASYAGAHSAQVSFPGGKIEGSETVFEAALREAHEEIGVIQKDIQVIGQLSDFDVLPSNFIVTPVVGVIEYVPTFFPDEREVDAIIQAELSDVLADNAVREKEILAAGVYTMMAPHFLIEEEIVWGATAMILNELRVVINELPMANS
jgi:8-oxo-dGTP pyrophosphatase MutT (NUDIX family)